MRPRLLTIAILILVLGPLGCSIAQQVTFTPAEYEQYQWEIFVAINNQPDREIGPVTDRLEFLQKALSLKGARGQLHARNVDLQDRESISKFYKTCRALSDELKDASEEKSRQELTIDAINRIEKILSDDGLHRLWGFEVISAGPINYFRRNDIQKEYQITPEQLREIRSIVIEAEDAYFKEDRQKKTSALLDSLQLLSKTQRNKLAELLGFDLRFVCSTLAYKDTEFFRHYIRLHYAESEKLVNRGYHFDNFAYHDSTIGLVCSATFHLRLTGAERHDNRSDERNRRFLQVVSTVYRPFPVQLFDTDPQLTAPGGFDEFLSQFSNACGANGFELQAGQLDGSIVNATDPDKAIFFRKAIKRETLLPVQLDISRQCALAYYGPLRIAICEPLCEYLNISKQDRKEIFDGSLIRWEQLSTDIQNAKAAMMLSILDVLEAEQREILENKIGISIAELSKHYGLVSDTKFFKQLGWKQTQRTYFDALLAEPAKSTAGQEK